jgi:hypothetical protein
MILRYTKRDFLSIKRALQTPDSVLQIPTLIYKKWAEYAFGPHLNEAHARLF